MTSSTSTSTSTVSDIEEEDTTTAHSNTVDDAAAVDAATTSIDNDAHGRRIDADHTDKKIYLDETFVNWMVANVTIKDPAEDEPSVAEPCGEQGLPPLVISPEYVLMAAACVPVKTSIAGPVLVGFDIVPDCTDGCDEEVFSSFSGGIDAKKIIIHPGYNPDQGFDDNAWALVRLADSLPKTAKVFDIDHYIPNLRDLMIIMSLSPTVSTADWMYMTVCIDDDSANKDWCRAVFNQVCYIWEGGSEYCNRIKLDVLLKSSPFSGKGKGNGKGNENGKGNGTDDKPAVTVKKNGKHSKSRAKMSIALNKDGSLIDAKEKVPDVMTKKGQAKVSGDKTTRDRRRLQRRRGQATNVQGSLYDFNVTNFEFQGVCSWEEQQGYPAGNSCFVATFDTNVMHNVNLSEFEANEFSRALLEESAESIATEVEGVVGVQIIDFGEELTTEVLPNNQLEKDSTVSRNDNSWVIPTTLIVVLTALAFIVIAAVVVIRKRKESSHYASSDGERDVKDSTTLFSDFNWGGAGAGGAETAMKDRDGVQEATKLGEEDNIIDDRSDDGTKSATTRGSTVFRQYKFPSIVQV